MEKKDYEAIISRIVPSRQMREFLCLPDNKLSPSELAEVIIGSPEIVINEKHDLLCSLAIETEDKEISESAGDFKAAIDNLNCATGELFTVDDPWYDEDIKDVSYSGFGNQPCVDFNKVLEYIDWKYKYEECDSDSCTWYEIKKWVPDENGRYINTYNYYYIYGIGICWFAACREYGDEGPYSRLPEHKYSSACIDLNIATPFRVGDIVRVDCRPFAPPVNALILYAGPDWDCCSLLALYRDDIGRYRTGAVKHTDMWLHLRGDNMISALFRIETYDGELNEFDRIYNEISLLIYGDNKKGNNVLNYLSENRDFSLPGELLKKVKELF